MWRPVRTLVSMTTPSGRAHVPGSMPPPGSRASGRATVGAGAPSARRPVDSPPGGPGGPGKPPVYGRPGGRRGPRPRWGRIALVGAAALALIVLLGGFGVYLYAQKLYGQVGRTDAFGGINTSRPPVSAPGAMNILLLGSDSRD